MKTIKETIDAYAEGAYKADIELLGKVFSSDALLKGYIKGEFYVLTMPDFLKMTEEEESMESRNLDFKYEIAELMQDEDMAFVKLVETNYDGIDYIDYMSLVKINDNWEIAYKLFIGK